MSENVAQSSGKSVGYWRSRSPGDRLAEIMRLRQERYGEVIDQGGVKRVIRIHRLRDYSEKLADDST